MKLRVFSWIGRLFGDPKDKQLGDTAAAPDVAPAPLDLVPMTADEMAGRFSAERLRALRPDLYWGCVELLARHVGVDRISELLRVDYSTVCEVSLHAGTDIHSRRLVLNDRPPSRRSA